MNTTTNPTGLSVPRAESFAADAGALGIESFGLWAEESGGVRMCACRTESAEDVGSRASTA